jgi:hypothetical protein
MDMTILINVQNHDRFINRIAIIAKRDLPTHPLNRVCTDRFG